MALRVLLADESSTIKKVMQLALQDFAVEVKAVHVGVDVLEVARAFKPDLIFVDVLLQKRNGYEVCAELRGDAATRHTPTVLMWSSFMELDQDQLAKAQPTEKIEKPFDVETLRKLVLQLVPETRSQRLAHFLEFPESANESMKQDAVARTTPPPTATEKTPTRTSIPVPPPTPNTKPGVPVPPPTQTQGAIPLPPPVTKTGVPTPPPVSQTRTGVTVPPPTREEEKKASWNMESFDDINEYAREHDEFARESDVAGDLGSPDSAEPGEDFAPVNLSKSEPEAGIPEFSLEPTNEPAEEAWAAQDLSRFKIELPPVSVESGDLDLKIDMGEEEFTASGFLYKPGANEPELETAPIPAAPPAREPRRPEPRLELEAMPPDEDRTQPVLEIPEATSQIGLTLEREEVPEPLEPMITRDEIRRTTLGADAGDIPRLSVDRLEEIVRAQSREIIEDLVRRIVPDIATAMIKEELDRLLEESSVRDTRRRESRP